MHVSRMSARGSASLSVLSMMLMLPAAPAHAQLAPSSVVSVCTGVSLPRSVVTSIMGPVVTGIYAPIENNLNGTLSVLTNPLLGITGLPAPLSVNVNGLLTSAASGSNITLQAIASDGTLIGPGDPCNAQADSYTLANPLGVSIGGNAVTGLGATGQTAFAGEIDSIAIGNRAATDPLALGSIAIGADALVGSSAGGSIAFGRASAVSVANSVALGAGSVASRGAQAGSVGEISVGGPGALRQITNVAAGTAATDVATVGQLQALSSSAVHYSDGSSTSVVLAGAGGTTISNVAAGAVTASSSDAVNGAQLHATNQQVATNTTAINLVQGEVTQLQSDVTANTTAITTLQSSLSATNVAVSNLQADVAAIQSGVTNNITAVTSLQADMSVATTAITTIQASVANHSTAITNLEGDVAINTADISLLEIAVSDIRTDLDLLSQQVGNLDLGDAGPVRYSDAATPTTPNGGTPSNDVTLVGTAGGAVRVHNVAAGVVAAGSTDAVNGSQLAATNVAVATVQVTANQALELGQNAVAYDSAARTSVTLGGAGAGQAVQLRNVAAGTLGTDGVNLNQVRDLADNALRSANAYTDQRLAAFSFDLGEARKEARAGSAAALAAAGMPQAMDAGANMIAAGVGTYRGRTALAIGASHRNERGNAVFRIGLTYDSSASVGANGGAGIQF